MIVFIVLSGLESVAQSSLAELPGETSMANTDVMAAMETIQTQKQQQRGLTNISVEEQKILLSLDRLNNRLQCEHFPKTNSLFAL